MAAALLALVPLLIADDEAGAQSMSVVSVPESLSVSESAGTVDIVVTLSSSVEGTVAVFFSEGPTGDADAHDATEGQEVDEDRDFTQHEDGDLVIPAGSTMGTISIEIVDDALDEHDEVFYVELDSVIATGEDSVTLDTSASSTVVTITDDDAEPSLSLSPADAEVSEGDSAALTAQLGAVSGRDVTVTWGTALATDGTAQTRAAQTDFTAVTDATATIPAGMLSASLSVSTVEDSVAESDERFAVVVSEADYATGEPLTRTVTILDDEPRLAINPDAAAADVNEDVSGGTLSLSVVLERAADADVTFDWTTAASTQGSPATVGDDYTTSSGNDVTIAAGQTQATIMVPIVNDNLKEASRQSFVVRLSDLSSNALLADVPAAQSPGRSSMGEVTVWIVDDEPAAQVSLTGNVTVEEGSAAVFTVSVDRAADHERTVVYDAALISSSRIGGSGIYAPVTAVASSGDVAVVTSGEATLAAGQTSVNVSVATTDDDVGEPDEYFEFRVDDLRGAAYAAGETPMLPDPVLGLITDNEPRIAIEASSSDGLRSVSEDAGTVTLTVSLSQAATSQVSVGWTTAARSDGGRQASAGTDFTSGSGTLTFAAGEQTKSFTVAILDDDVYEPFDEGFVVRLRNLSANAYFGGSPRDDHDSVTVAIQSDDDPPDVSVADSEAEEGDRMIFEVTLSRESQVALLIRWSTGLVSDGDAATRAAAADFTAVSLGTLTIQPGSTAGFVTVNTTEDSDAEFHERFAMTPTQLARSDSTTLSVGLSGATGTILNDDRVQVTVGDATVDEDAPGGDAVVTVTLERTWYEDVSVQWRTDATGRAVSGTDFTGVSAGTVQIAAGQMSSTLSVAITDDSLDEHDEAFEVVLSNPTGTAALADDMGNVSTTIRAEVTVVDDDDPPVVSVAAGTGTEGGPISFEVTLSAVSGRDVVVQYHTEADTAAGARQATVDVDYTPVAAAVLPADAASVTVPEGSTSVTLTVASLQDALDEYDETFTVVLDGAHDTAHNADTGTVSPTAGTATGAITDDDPLPTVKFNAGSLSAAIFESQVNPFERAAFRLSAVSGRDVVIQYRTGELPTAVEPTIDSTVPPFARAGEDFVAEERSVTIPAGDTNASAVFSIIGDSLDEWAETFGLYITSALDADGVAVAQIPSEPVNVIVVTDDDPRPLVSIAAGSGAEGDAVNFVMTLSEASGRWVAVQCRTGLDATGSHPAQAADFVSSCPETLIAPGETEATLSIGSVADRIDEFDQTFTVTLTGTEDNYGAQTGDTAAVSPSAGSAVGTIVDDDPLLRLGLVSSTVDESVGTVSVEIVTLEEDAEDSLASEKPITVGYETADPRGAVLTSLESPQHAATQVHDYQAASGTLTIAPVPSPESVTADMMRLAGFDVTVEPDSLYEWDEVIELALLTATNARVSDVPATVTITDDDDPPTVEVSVPDVTLSDGVTMAGGVAESVAEVVAGIGLSAPSGRPVTVGWETQDLADDILAALAAGLTCADFGASPLPLGCIRIREHAATPDADYTPGSGSLSFAAVDDPASAVAAQSVTVAVLADVLDEWDEAFGIGVDPTNATAPAAVPVVRIVDDDDAPWWSILPSDRGDLAERATAYELGQAGLQLSGVGVESEGSLFVRGQLSEVSGRSASLGVRTLAARVRPKGLPDGTLGVFRATPGADFEVVPGVGNDGVWVIGPGLTDGRFELALVDDTQAESLFEELFVVELHGAEHAVLAGYDGDPAGPGADGQKPGSTAEGTLQVVLEVRDDDRDRLMEVADVTVREDAASVTVTVSLPASVESTRPAFTAECSTADQTAVAPGDYTAVSAQAVSFDPAVAASRSATVTVAVADDAASEADETFVVSCTTTGLATAQSASGIVTITDTSALPEVSLSPVSLTRGESSGSATLTVSLSVPSGRDVSVRLRTADGTAVAGADYEAVTATVSIPPGVTSVVFPVGIIDDETLEADETFTVTLAGPRNADLGSSVSSTVTIDDDDDLPLITIADASAAESAAEMAFTVTLAPMSGSPVTVSWQTEDRTAVSPGDYAAGSGTVTIPAGQTRATVTVALADDADPESAETFAVTLSDPVGARVSLSAGTATGTIRDDDQPAATTPPPPPATGGGSSTGGGGSGGGSSGGGGGGGGDVDVGVAVFVVANGWSPADVGVASVLAARTDGAVVTYTEGDALSAETAVLLRDALPAEVIIVGGAAAVSRDVRTEIRSASPGSGTERVTGAGRADTAAAAARRVLGEPSTAGRVTVVVANGWSSPDIGAAAALAARTRRSAVLYVQQDALPEASAAVLRDYDTARVVLIGGAAAISSAVEDRIAAAAADADIDRLTGADRVGTAAAAARRVLADPAAASGAVTLVIANGWSPPDVGVAAAYAAATDNAAVAYTASGSLPEATAELIRDYRPARVVIIGGRAAVADTVRTAIADTAPADTDIRRITGTTRTHTAAQAARSILRQQN
ncbi:Calx-beta domain-containing protein [Candidatus Poriferisodalis sp.]|uniref:Calx-beta domain-containing protein n=1 Tax=Candidatus Poriferisodalis sp. TaxID=3101277 RepID=UPI003B0251D3